MKIEVNVLILVCVTILIISAIKKPKSTETFLDACQYHQLPGSEAGEVVAMKQNYDGRTGIELEKEKITPQSYRASWIRRPEPRYKMECSVDAHLNRKCWWKPIYTDFYPNLRGNQQNMISP